MSRWGWGVVVRFAGSTELPFPAWDRVSALRLTVALGRKSCVTAGLKGTAIVIVGDQEILQTQGCQDTPSLLGCCK